MAPARQGPHERPGPYLSRQHHQGLRRPSRLRGLCAQGSHRGNRQEWGHNATGLACKFYVEFPKIIFKENIHRHLVHPPWFHPLPARVERPVAVGRRRPLEGANSNWFFFSNVEICALQMMKATRLFGWHIVSVFVALLAIGAAAHLRVERERGLKYRL